MLAKDVARVGGIDGLRGLAALVVLVHHSLLVVPVLAAPYFTHEATAGGLAAVLLFTPLHLAWIGPEAVYVFFVISGFVLVHWARSDPAFTWLGYGLSRAVRLYGPVIAAVALAALSIVLIPRNGDLPSLWLAGRDTGYTPATFLQDIVLVFGNSGIVTPLWSLRWEIVFSALLPLVVWIVGRGFPVVLLILSVAVATISFWVGSGAPAYLAFFMMGAALAGDGDPVGRVARRIATSRGGRWISAAVLVASLLLLCSYWMLLPVAGDRVASAVSRPAVVVAVVLLFLCAVHPGPFHRFLTTAPLRWLGLISFSLYLVHEPIVVAIATLTGAAVWAIPVSIAVSLLVGFAFWWLIEKRIHRLARWLTRRFARKAEVGDAR
jgi:peptidoglycan/LPS O-acetylase OafA/YrhL